MKLELKDVDRDNLSAVVKLEVAEDQKGFVAPNVFSLAQAKVYPSCLPQAIYADDALVGFAMFGRDDEDEDRWWLSRLMIAPAHQGKGYGRQAMGLVIDRIRQADPAAREMFLSVEPENTVAVGLYRALGFDFDGRVLEGEHVMRLAL